MRRVIAIAVAGASLAGCSSFSWDSFKSAPAPVQVQLESTPPGADAVTSVGPGCKTPCTVSVAAPDSGFSVTFNLPKYESATVPVTVVRNPGDLTTAASTVVDPNPVVAELKPTAPPPKARKLRPKRPKPAAAAAAPAAESATAAGTPFPDPNAPVQR
ncbi:MULTISPECIES: hypothetical protein [unclassified Bradyrhizobium]